MQEPPDEKNKEGVECRSKGEVEEVRSEEEEFKKEVVDELR